MKTPPANRLAGETSPYLLQHADNPVDWYPWGAEALELARQQDKPILLSIGYSACHWCHVMAHESFEDVQTAALMNRLYVNIKVDREERPDIDRIYQLALQMLSRRNGGWPLTMFLAPGSLAPFFGGTYFPPAPRYGMPAFNEVLERVAAFYHEQREALEAQNAELLEAFSSLGRSDQRPGTPDAAPLDMARHQLEHKFDRHHGGFGSAPKFPHPPNITRLLRHYAASLRHARPDEQALQMALTSLERMAEGGIHDHLGGGFCRYSVDAQWMIPHFEKMLYDNAQLLPQYALAAQITGAAVYRRVAAQTATWVMREMQDPDGGYYSALDADSEGEEGRFHVWSLDEVRGLLTDDQYVVIARRYGLDRPANFEHRWHLHACAGLADIAAETGHDLATIERLIDQGRERLFTAREQRVHPGCDDKILTAWNALMIRGMMIAARVLGVVEWQASAERALAFIRTRLWQNGRLLATSRGGRSHLPAYLDDHAFLLDALLEALQNRWRNEDLEFAIQIADALLEHFEDSVHGGFFFTAHDHEKLIHRPKPFGDDALPSGNGIAARALLRLGHLLGETRYSDAAERALVAGWSQISELPFAHNTMLDALEEYLEPPQIIVLRGEDDALAEWRAPCLRAFAPSRLCFAIPSGVAGLPGLLAARTAPPTGVRAYVCSGTSCQAPIEALATFTRSITASGG